MTVKVHYAGNIVIMNEFFTAISEYYRIYFSSFLHKAIAILSYRKPKVIIYETG